MEWMKIHTERDRTSLDVIHHLQQAGRDATMPEINGMKHKATRKIAEVWTERRGAVNNTTVACVAWRDELTAMARV